ncbi:hypothetical protein RWE15_17865 [Virgibacillus halophilus]|uniref:WD40-like Beta Propeller Repeat n=1 Tax=Tigheibacillus halophilus TaxID=361280 RepID=A0ABU5C9B6_9BACI|nr:hypothetical protein [Virgibacillus halophilus]
MAKRALTAHDLTRLVGYSDPQLVPGKNTYFYTETAMDKEKDEYVSHLFVHNLEEDTAKQWTFGNHKDRHPRLSADGKQIVFQSDRSGTQQIWIMPVAGGEARQLTAFTHGAHSPQWSKDGNYIFFSASLAIDDDVNRQKELTSKEKKARKEEINKKTISYLPTPL